MPDCFISNISNKVAQRYCKSPLLTDDLPTGTSIQSCQAAASVITSLSSADMMNISFQHITYGRAYYIRPLCASSVGCRRLSDACRAKCPTPTILVPILASNPKQSGPSILHGLGGRPKSWIVGRERWCERMHETPLA